MSDKALHGQLKLPRRANEFHERASVMPSHVSKLWALGAIDVFKKPFDPQKLPDQVRAAVAKSK